MSTLTPGVLVCHPKHRFPRNSPRRHSSLCRAAREVIRVTPAHAEYRNMSVRVPKWMALLYNEKKKERSSSGCWLSGRLDTRYSVVDLILETCPCVYQSEWLYSIMKRRIEAHQDVGSVVDLIAMALWYSSKIQFCWPSGNFSPHLATVSYYTERKNGVDLT